MEILKKWIDQNGSEGRAQLFKAIKAEYPRFTQASLTNYIQGDRIPDRDRAGIMAKVMGVSLEALNYRYVHRPSEQETTTPESAVSLPQDSPDSAAKAESDPGTGKE